MQPGRRWRWGIEHLWIHLDSSDSKETAAAALARNFRAFDYFVFGINDKNDGDAF